MIPLLTIFTPTFNRKHTIVRTYESLCRQTSKDFEWLIIDDGSSDDTMDWVLSLGHIVETSGPEYDWMGRSTGGVSNETFVIDSDGMRIQYVRKPNGGLYTGYNVAYNIIRTELCVCIDSDDFAPDDMVEKVKKRWTESGSDKYCGVFGLDFKLDGTPLGGYLPDGMTECNRIDLYIKKIHVRDSKEVMRTDLMRKVSPQIGFKGEKNFNPSYMLSQIWDKYPMLVINDNLCFVDYQVGVDSMSEGIYKQYVNSPRSFAKHRILHMKLSHYPYSVKFKSAAHYISSCMFCRDKDWFKNTPMKITTILAIPLGIYIHFFIKHRI